MKKICIIASALTVIALNSNAQGLYFRAGLGYDLPHNGQTVDNYGNPYNGSVTISGGSYTYSLKNASFASGAYGDLAIGYTITRNIGIELDGTFGLANKKYTGKTNGLVSGGVTYNESSEQYAKIPIILMPSVVLQSGGRDVNLYMRAGLALPLSTKTIKKDTYINEPGSGAQEVEVDSWKTSHKFSFGFAGALGIQCKISDNINFWGEVRMLSLSIYPDKSTLTDLTVNGTSYISRVSSSYKTTTYKNNITTNSGYQQPSYAIPFSSIGIHAGISFTVGNGRHKTKKSALTHSL